MNTQPSSKSSMVSPTPTRVSSGSSILDQMLGGGFLCGSANLIEGAAGTGKSTLGLQFLWSGMDKGEAALIVTFEEFPEQYYQCALELGWDLKKKESEGLLEIIFTSAEEFVENITNPDSALRDIIEKLNVKRTVIDSITNLERLAKSPIELRQIETDVVNFFKGEEITTLILKENTHILGGLSLTGNKIAFIVDSFLVLRYIELKSSIQRGLLILKMRGSNHAKEIRQYTIDKGGLHIGDSFTGITGIFSGAGTTVRH